MVTLVFSSFFKKTKKENETKPGKQKKKNWYPIDSNHSPGTRKALANLQGQPPEQLITSVESQGDNKYIKLIGYQASPPPPSPSPPMIVSYIYYNM